MYCNQCGAKIAENAQFCVACGARRDAAPNTEQDIPETDGVSVDAAQNGADLSENMKATVQKLSEKAAQSSALRDAGRLLKKYFSAQPVSAVSEAAASKSSFWIVALAVNIVFFAFVSCHNVAQMLNHCCNALIDQLIKGAASASSLAGIAGSFVPDVNIGALYSMFIYYGLLAALMFGIEFLAVYLPMQLLKKKPDSPLNILNLQGVASLPLSAALVINFLVGFVYPPLTVCIFIVALCLHINLIYEGLKTLPRTAVTPMWSVGIVVFFVVFVVMILLGILIGNGLNQAVTQVAQYMSLLDGLF